MWNDPGSGTAERRFENVFEAVPDFYVVDNDGFRLKHKKDGKDFTKETYLFRILIKNVNANGTEGKRRIALWKRLRF